MSIFGINTVSSQKFIFNEVSSTNNDYDTKASQKVKNICAYSPHTCFVAADHWFLVFSVMLKIASCSYTSDLVTW